MHDKTRRAGRPRGTGSLLERVDAAGRVTWSGKFWSGGRQVKRRIGPRREPGSQLGLTRTQAEAELRRLMANAAAAPPAHESLTLAEAGERYLHHVEHVRERKRSTVQDYRIILRRHLAPFFAGRRLDAVDPDLVAAYIATKRRDGLASKTVTIT